MRLKYMQTVCREVWSAHGCRVDVASRFSWYWCRSAEGFPLPDNRSHLPNQRLLFARGSWSETSRISAILRKETVGGALLLLAAVVALAWANSPWSASYDALRELHVGTNDLGLHLHLSLATWASDGLLAIFFFVVGLELKREFVAGDLRDPARAA